MNVTLTPEAGRAIQALLVEKHNVVSAHLALQNNHPDMLTHRRLSARLQVIDSALQALEEALGQVQEVVA